MGNFGGSKTQFLRFGEFNFGAKHLAHADLGEFYCGECLTILQTFSPLNKAVARICNGEVCSCLRHKAPPKF